MGLGVGGGIVAEDKHDDNDADEVCGFFCLRFIIFFPFDFCEFPDVDPVEK